MRMEQMMMQQYTKVLWRCEEVNLKLNKEKCHLGAPLSLSLGR